MSYSLNPLQGSIEDYIGEKKGAIKGNTTVGVRDIQGDPRSLDCSSNDL